jgi:hypothetical protein
MKISSHAFVCSVAGMIESAHTIVSLNRQFEDVYKRAETGVSSEAGLRVWGFSLGKEAHQGRLSKTA